MVAVPTATGATTPPSTVDTKLSLELHFMVWLLALSGATLAFRVPAVPPAVKVRVATFRVTPVTDMGVSLGVLKSLEVWAVFSCHISYHDCDSADTVTFSNKTVPISRELYKTT